MSANLNNLEEIEELQKLILEQQNFIEDTKEANYAARLDSETPSAYAEGDLRPDNPLNIPQHDISKQESNLAQLNRELDTLTNQRILNAQKTIPFTPEDLPESVEDKDEVQPPGYQSYDDLIQPYRDVYPKKGDSYIERIIKFEDRDLYNAITGGDRKPDKFAEEGGIPEAAQYQIPFSTQQLRTGGFTTNALKLMKIQAWDKQLKHNVPGAWASHTMLDWVPKVKIGEFEIGGGRLSKAMFVPLREKQRKDKLRREILSNPNNHLTGFEVENYIKRLADEDNLEEGITNEWYAMGRDTFKRLIKEDPDVQSYMKYTLAEGNEYLRFGKEDTFGKNVSALTKLVEKTLIDALPSILETRSAGAFMAMVAKKINPQLALLSTGLQMGGQFAVGGMLEASATAADAVEFLINDEELTPTKMNRAMSEARALYKKEFKELHPDWDDTQLYNKTEEKVEAFLLGYEKTEDGRYFRKGLDPIEAIEMTHATFAANFIASGIIEMSDVIGANFDLPFTGKIMHNTMLGKTITKMDDAFRVTKAGKMVDDLGVGWKKLRTVEAGDSWSKSFANQFFDSATGKGAKIWAESFEEIAQANSEHAIRAYGPLGITKLKFDKGANYVDEWNVDEHIILPGLGGLGGGKVANQLSNAGNFILEQSGLYGGINKRSVSKQMNKSIGGTMIEKIGPREYGLVVNTSRIDSKGNLVYKKTKLYTETGKGFKYGTYQSAKKASDEHNLENLAKHNINFTKENLYLADSEVKRRKDGDNWIVEVIGKNGSVLKTIGKYSKISEAKSASAKVQSNINTVNKAVDKTGLNKILKLADDVNKARDNKIADSEEIKETDDFGIGFVDKDKKILNRKSYKILIKGYMQGTKKTGTDEIIELNKDEEREWSRLRDAGYHSDAAFLAANALEYSDVFNEEMIDIDIFKSDFLEEFGEEFKDSDYLESFESEEDGLTVQDDYENTTVDSEKTKKEIKDLTEKYEVLSDVPKDSDEDFLSEGKDEDGKTITNFEIISSSEKDVVEEKELAETDLDPDKKKPAKKMNTQDMVNEINENLDNLSDKDITSYINEIDKRMKDRISKMMNPDSISPKVAEMEDAIKKAKDKLKEDKKAPEVKEDMVTILGNPLLGEDETMTRAEAEKRLEQLLHPDDKHLPGEHGAQEEMIAGAEIEALQEALAKKKAPEVKEEVIIPEIVSDTSILDNRSNKLNLTDGQTKALILLSKWLNINNLPDSENYANEVKDKVFVLSGYAGTGKTTIIENMIMQATVLGYATVLFGAITNRATQVIKGKLPRIKDMQRGNRTQIGDKTVASMFFGKPNRKTGKFKVKDRVEDPYTTLYIIDESSMIGSKEFMAMFSLAIVKGGKFIFIGDTFQLPAIKEPGAPLFTVFTNITNMKQVGDGYVSIGDSVLDKSNSYKLSQVMRQKNRSSILSLATAMRVVGETNGIVNDSILYPRTSSPDGNVIVVSETELRSLFINSWGTGEDYTMIVHSNVAKNELNKLAREEKFKDKIQVAPYIAGSGQSYQDRIIVPKFLKGEMIMVVSNTELKSSKVSNGDIFEEGLNFNSISEPKIIKNVRFKQQIYNNTTKKTEYYIVKTQDGLNQGYATDSSGNKTNLRLNVVGDPVYFEINYTEIVREQNQEDITTSQTDDEGSISDAKEDNYYTHVILFPSIPTASIQNAEGMIDTSNLPAELITEVLDANGEPTGQFIVKPEVIIVTYGYTLTAHKAQGSEWGEMSVLFPYYFKLPPRPAFKAEINRWLYTAITRAQSKVFLSDASDSTNPNLRLAEWSEIDELTESVTEGNKKDDSKKQYQLSDTKVTSPINQAKVRKYTKMMFDKFEGLVDYVFINDVNLVNNLGAPIGAFYGPISKEMADKYNIKQSDTPMVLINLPLADVDTPFHEFMHPFITDIRNTNPRLYEKLVIDILDTKSGKKLLSDVIDGYNELSPEDMSGIVDELGEMLSYIDGDVTDISGLELYELLKKHDSSDRILSDELIAYMVGKAAAAKVPKNSKWKRILNTITSWIRNKLFGANWTVNVYARGLTLDTGIADIARLLVNSKRHFTLEKYDKKLYNENYDFKVDTRARFWLFSKKKVEKEIPLDNIFEDIKVKQATINRMFKEMWKMSKIKGKKMDKNDFASLMIGDRKNAILPEVLQGHFNVWFKSFFHVEAEIGNNDYAVLDEQSHNLLVEYMEENDEYINRNIMGRLETNEKESSLASATLLYIKEFGYTLEESELKEIMKMARRMDFEHEIAANSWINFVFKHILKVPFKRLTPYRKRVLQKFYNQIQSTLITNRGEEAQGIINWEMLMDEIGNFNMIKKSKVKSNKAPGENSSNAGFQKKTLFDFYDESKNLFSFISGSDIRRLSVSPKYGEQIKTLYGFLNEEEMIAFSTYLIDQYGLAIAFSRGSSDKLALVDINNPKLEIQDKLSNLAKYLDLEVKEGLMTESQAKQFLKNIPGLNKNHQLAEIAVHESLKQVWPKYLVDGKNSANIFKRLKIPFTPVTVNEKMEDTRFYRFDPREVLFQYKDDKPYSPMKKVKGKGFEYIGDGETLTSRIEFQKYGFFHGLTPGTAIAKTVHYIKRGLDTFALKHQSFLAEPGLKILDKTTKKVLYEVTDSGNIYLAESHPDYVVPSKKISAGKKKFAGIDNYVGMLGTVDEVKIGAEVDKDGNQIGIFKDTDELIIPGSAIGFIKFEEGMDKKARHPQQWYNHVMSKKIIEHFKNSYLPKIEGKLRDAIRVAIDTPNSTAASKIAGLMNLLDGRKEDTRISSFKELIKLGAGFHRQTSIIVDKFIYKNLLDDIMRLGFGVGSTYNIAMDATNRLDDKGGEVALYDKDPAVKKIIHTKYMESNDITSMENVKTEDINKWLATNVVNVMITRFPVPHEGGAIMSRVKFLHKREAVIMMGINDVKGRLEGDNDGDHVQVEFLPEEIEADYKEHLDNIDAKVLNLPNFENPKNKNKIEITAEGRAQLIAKLTAGEWAIGELANIQGEYGTIVQLFNNIYPEGIKTKSNAIRIKNMDEEIELPYYHAVRGVRKPWKGPISEYLRLLLQAAVDNGKFGLLGEWEYTRESVIENLIEINPSFTEEQKSVLIEKYVMPFFTLHKMPLNIRKGRESGKIERFGLKDGIEMSDEYTSYVNNRDSYLFNNLKISVDKKEVSDDYMSPLEMVGTSISMINSEMHNKLSKANKDLLFRDISPYIITIELHGKAHYIAMESLNKSLSDKRKIAVSKDDSKDELDDIIAGEEYAEKMGAELEILIEDFGGEMTATNLDYNLSFMAFQEGWNEEFKKLSNVAKLSATYRFLRGDWAKEVQIFNPMTQKMETRKVKGSPLGLHFPPVSEQSNQVSLLDPTIIKEYFELFNKAVREAKDDTKSKPKYRSLYNIAKQDC